MSKFPLAIAPDPEAARLAQVQRRIRSMWKGGRGPQNNMGTQGGNLGINPSGITTYPTSDVTGISSDFLGDWRSLDGWQRFDMLRVRGRSRQLERGNGHCQSFKRSLIQNTIGHAGFRLDPNVLSSLAFGDASEGVVDKAAKAMILAARKQFEKPENFTTKKKLAAIDVDALLISRLCFDGEFILRKIKKFDNEFGFSWQMINPDYLDHNLNRVEENGNIIKMGVELEKDWKYPVAYWFFHRRPNDYFYNYAQYNQNRYYRVPADEVIHRFVQTEDDEQTRGWPWIFAVAVNLFRLGKFEEAAVVNAVIGASKMGFFKKIIPQGFAGDINQLKDEDEGAVIDVVSPGSWQELPWNVEAQTFDPKYPDDALEGFEKVMLRGIASCMGSSYMALSGDVSDANFSNLQAAQNEELENWKWLQEWLIRYWKLPEYDEFIYRSILARKIKLPLSKLEKFTDPRYTGRRWMPVNPVDFLKAKQLAMQLRITSPTDVIEAFGGNREEVFAQIKRDTEDLAAQGTPLTLGNEPKEPAQPDGEEDDATGDPDSDEKDKPEEADDDEHDPTI